MPRSPRIDLPGLPQHLVVRGNDRQPIFFSEADRLYFLQCLAEARVKRECEVHAFVLMSNHVHILATPLARGSASRMMQDVGRTYVLHVNKLHGRTGALYEGRFHSSVIESSRYFLACMRYIEMNPVRAKIVARPAEHRWSSHGQNITGEPTGLVTPHVEYRNLGCDAAARSLAYRRLFDESESDEEIEALRRGARQGRAVGGEVFCEGLARIVGRPVSFAPQGRPPRVLLSPFRDEKGSDPF